MRKKIAVKEPEIDTNGIESIIKAYGTNLRRSNLLGLLQKTQDEYGYLPRKALEMISEEAHIPLARIFGVASFYNMFSFIPKGEYTIKICTGTACHVKDSDKVVDRFKDLLGIKKEETTNDYKFTLEGVNCVGTCAVGPIVIVERKGKEVASLGKFTPEILKGYSAEELYTEISTGKFMEKNKNSPIEKKGCYHS